MPAVAPSSTTIAFFGSSRLTLCPIAFGVSSPAGLSATTRGTRDGVVLPAARALARSASAAGTSWSAVAKDHSWQPSGTLCMEACW